MAAVNPVAGGDARTEPRKQKITTFLWFDNNAEEAANFYVSVFKNSRIIKTARYPEGSPGPQGAVMTVDFELDGQEFIALNGGPHFKFTEAISLVVHCKTQEEVDYYWEKLTADGGQESQCGWLKDKYGLSWQITPDVLLNFWSEGDSTQAQRVMQAMMGMKKIIIKDIEAAAAG
ncbi:MAG TPA: VOC family protein [Pyrinomonadaceae bacterium]|nr:VOC family protein [Pyrinomonadaceae bacterium]